MLLQFPKRNHVRASAGCSAAGSRNANSDRSAVLPFSARASEKITNNSEGNLPRAFQLLTADGPTPPSSAALAGPPRASMTASSELSIPPNNSRFVNKSSLHGTAIVTDCELMPNIPMSRGIKDIAERLELTRDAIGLSAAEICRQTGIKPNQWSQYVNPDAKRPITRQAIYKLKDNFGVTLEWLYDNDLSRMPDQLSNKIRRKRRSAA